MEPMESVGNVQSPQGDLRDRITSCRCRELRCEHCNTCRCCETRCTDCQPAESCKCGDPNGFQPCQQGGRCDSLTTNCQRQRSECEHQCQQCQQQGWGSVKCGTPTRAGPSDTAVNQGPEAGGSEELSVVIRSVRGRPLPAINRPPESESAGPYASVISNSEPEQYIRVTFSNSAPTPKSRKSSSRRILLICGLLLLSLLAGFAATTAVLLLRTDSPGTAYVLNATPASFSTAPANPPPPPTLTPPPPPPTTTTTTSTTTTATTATTTTTTSQTTTTVQTSCTGNRKCHSCTSFSDRCPADGKMAGTDPGQVMDCPCDTACFSEIRPWNGVHRGCTSDFPLWEEKSRINLTCQSIGESFLCFCLGDRCNTHDMTVYPEYQGG